MTLRSLTRRRFLLLGAISGALGLLGGLVFRRRRPARDLTPLTQDEQALLARYLDLLIPADETPGALDLGVHRRLFDRAAENDYLRNLLHQGCAWVERESGTEPFLALSEDAQHALIARSERSERESVPYRLFERLRHFAFHDFYGDARSWASLGYQGPPQPLGFPDYRQPPRVHRG